MGATLYLHHIRSSAPGSSHGSSFCSAQPFSGDGDLRSGGASVGLASTSVGTGAATIPAFPDVGINNGGSNVGLANTSAGTPGTASIPALHDVGGGVHAGLATLPLLVLAVLVRLPCEATSGCSFEAS